MPLLIDGHNLIGAGVFSDINLSDEDDEEKLVARLRVFKGRYKGQIRVVFDRGIVEGRDQAMSGGGIEVIFARDPHEADDLILRRIQGREPGLVVVTNDAALCREAADHGVETWTAERFAQRMARPGMDSTRRPQDPGEEIDVKLTPEQVEDWMELFGGEDQ